MHKDDPETLPTDAALEAQESALRPLFDQSAALPSSDALERLVAHAETLSDASGANARPRWSSGRALALAALVMLGLGLAYVSQGQGEGEAQSTVALERPPQAPESAQALVKAPEGDGERGSSDAHKGLIADELAWHGEELDDGLELLGLPIGSDDPKRALELVDALIAELDDA